MYSKKIVFALTLLALTACATQSLNKNNQALEDLRKNDTYQKEKALYKERIGGRDFCWNIGIDDFLKRNSPKPSEKCIYPASPFIVEKEQGFLSQSKSLKQAFKQLKVLQVTSNGFVVKSPEYGTDKVIFIQKTNESNIVDGAFLDETQDWQLYEYKGPYTYSTLMGTSTVHSFTRVTDERLISAKKDLKLYGPRKDFLIENQLWDYLSEEPKN